MDSVDTQSLVEEMKTNFSSIYSELTTVVDVRNSSVANSDKKIQILQLIETLSEFDAVNFSILTSLLSCLVGLVDKTLASLDDTAENALEKASLLFVKARLFSDQGHHEKAELHMRACLEHRIASLGEEHKDSLHTLSRLGWLHFLQGRYDDAEAMIASALEKQRKLLPEKHEDVIYSADNLANLCYLQGRYDQAEELYRECVDARREKLGPHDPETLDAVNNLAVMFFSQGKSKEMTEHDLLALTT